MPGPVPGIHVFAAPRKDVDGRDEPGHDDFTHTTGLTPGKAITRSRKRLPRISKLRYWSNEAQAGDTKLSPDEQSDIRDFLHLDPAYRCAHAGYALRRLRHAALRVVSDSNLISGNRMSV